MSQSKELLGCFHFRSNCSSNNKLFNLTKIIILNKIKFKNFTIMVKLNSNLKKNT